MFIVSVDNSSSCLFVFCLVEKSVSEVQNNPVNLWEEGRIEDELSPEEIQMVCYYLLCRGQNSSNKTVECICTKAHSKFNGASFLNSL